MLLRSTGKDIQSITQFQKMGIGFPDSVARVLVGLEKSPMHIILVLLFQSVNPYNRGIIRTSKNISVAKYSPKAWHAAEGMTEYEARVR